MRRLNRRIFLRGLGGACVAAPFLGSVMGSGARAQSTTPRRLIAMFTYYGCVTTRWFPVRSHGPLTADDLTGTTLEPLTPYVDRLLMPRGIRAMNEWTMDMTLGQGNDPHNNVTGSYFTCQPLMPNSDDPLVPVHPRLSPMPIGPSLDHVIARQLSPDQQPLFIRVGNVTAPAHSAISFSGPEEMYPGIGSASQLFTALTGLFDGGGATSPASYAALRGQSILDIVKDDLETLERVDMSGDDRAKLTAWKELLHETSLVCTEARARTLGLSEEVVAITGGFGNDAVSTPIEGTSLDGADVYSNLAVLAAACNANSVIFLAYPANFTFSGLGLETTTAGLAYRVGSPTFGGPCVPNVLDQLTTIDAFYARKFAHLVKQLDELPDGDGSLLDGTAAVWFQEVSDGAARNLNNLPILQAGSCGGYFKTGWAINVEDGADDLTRGNSEAVCADGAEEFSASDATAKITGTDRTLANAPINKYFCNLMNALGVRAGEDGFPLVGGTEDVRCFGRYDRTEDFIGGDVNPPTIHDPGEFTELRAGS